MSERARENRSVRTPRIDPNRNLPAWDELWTPIAVESDTPDIVGWNHNYTGQEIAIKRCRDQFEVEARHGDLVNRVDKFDNFQIAVAFAEGFMEGHPDGGVL